SMIKDKFSDLKNPSKERKRIEYKIPLLNKNQFVAVTDKEMQYTVAQVIIKHPEREIKTTSDLRHNIIRSLYNQMMGARFGELMKQAEPPFLQGGSSISSFLAGLDDASAVVVAKPGELEKGFKAVFTEVERVRKHGFTATELERAKTSYMSGMEAALKEKDKTNSASYVQEYLQLFLKGTASPGIDYEYNFAKKEIPGIALNEVNNLTKQYLTENNRDAISMAPDKEKESLPTEGTVRSWIHSIAGSNIAAYVDQVSDKPLMAQAPAAGKVVSQQKNEKLGFTELTLS